jgi:hypothetical protein
MGLCIALTNESGENVEFLADDKNLLHKLLPPNDDDENPMLGSIDWYGDTIFNGVQMRRFLAEWRRLKQRAAGSEERRMADEVEGLAQRCKEEVHMYLKFIGD